MNKIQQSIVNFCKRIADAKFYIGNSFVIMGYFYDIVRILVFKFKVQPTLPGMSLILIGFVFLYWELFEEEKAERLASKSKF